MKNTTYQAFLLLLFLCYILTVFCGSYTYYDGKENGFVFNLSICMICYNRFCIQ